MTAVRPDDTAGTGGRDWYHEYGFVGAEDFEEIVEFATAHGFTFVYGGATRDAEWVGYPAECDRLVAAVREAERERDEWKNTAEVLSETDSMSILLREAEARAERLERGRAEDGAAIEALRVERDEAVARAERAKGALREIDANGHYDYRYYVPRDESPHIDNCPGCTARVALAAVSGEAPTGTVTLPAEDISRFVDRTDTSVGLEGPWSDRLTDEQTARILGEAPNDE